MTSSTPSRFLIGVPPIGATLEGYEFQSWFAFLGPAGVPKAIADRLNAAVLQLIKQPEIAERIAKQGADPLVMSPEQLGVYLKADFDRMANVVKAAGAKVE